ncbi:hypothetical protein P175DRAFT_0497933 [Aspergillus ochraceoroseus IBT 24754]|uniref:L-lactate dehydrogenase n=1 Tax=Aspergillus ochraceoroseus IBT 24754 TaxID=1392256 RepID=A0A2T5M8H7_9EURO|nr:uncharacterized protein P175DRAFT_0497933 [Aspergillus ochraceoroseus IBT 24754]PTU24825.1 hypothetical protein P175DRAFT_0497933 [Aspergillus ochraceoroseus IBT 24754]
MSSAGTKPISRIAIIGVGQVGAAAAYALILGSVANELLLVDVKSELRDAQVRDLSDVTYSGNRGTRVRAATYREAAECDVVVITAGSKYCIGQTSLEYTYRNVAILRTIVNTMKPFRSDAILLVVANPVDLLTSLARELSGLPSSQVLGSGTFLDSVRLRGLLADKTGIAATSIDLYAVGIHGEQQVPAWSTATVAGVPLDQALPATAYNRSEIVNECKHRSQSIIKAKGAMPLGIGSIVCSICSSILLDKHNVRPVSHFQQEYGCCFSLPVVLGRRGIVQTIQMPLSADEKAHIAESATALKGTLDRVKEV